MQALRDERRWILGLSVSEIREHSMGTTSQRSPVTSQYYLAFAEARYSTIPSHRRMAFT